MSEFIYTFHKYPIEVGEIHKDIMDSDLDSLLLHVDATDEDKPANVSVYLSSSLTQNQLVELLGIVNSSSTIVTPDCPTGTIIFNPSIQSDRFWQKHYGIVFYPQKLSFTPASISLTNVTFDGLADLTILEITDTSFEFCVTSLGQPKKWGTCEVSFTWEATL